MSPGMPGDMPARSAQDQADKLQKSAGEHGMKGPGRGGGGPASPAPVGGGARSDADRGPVGEGLENADQKQLDRELAAIGRQDRPGLPDKDDAGGGAKLEKGTTLSDSTAGAGNPGKQLLPQPWSFSNRGCLGGDHAPAGEPSSPGFGSLSSSARPSATRSAGVAEPRPDRTPCAAGPTLRGAFRLHAPASPGPG